MTRIIFLDVDGPMIPGRQWRQGPEPGRWSKDGRRLGWRFDPECVWHVTELAARTGARIVWNSAHCQRGATALARDAVASGLRLDFIHADAVTCYPGMTWLRPFSLPVTRLGAIRQWLIAHRGVTAWVVLDDEWLWSKNAVRVKYKHGITAREVDKAAEILQRGRQPCNGTRELARSASAR